MRELYLHIGLHKTGTTYLQKLVAANIDLLRQAGLGMGPHQDPEKGGHRIFQALRRESFAGILDRAAALPGDRMLISDEQISWLMEDPEEAVGIREAAARHFTPKIVVFLRRQDYLKESVQAQIVQHYGVWDVDTADQYNYDHDARLRMLEEIFGRKNMIVRLYRDEGRNDLAGAFLDALGVAGARPRLRQVPRQNVSMHRRKLLFMSQGPDLGEKIPRDPARPKAGRRCHLAEFMSSVLGPSTAVANDGQRFLMSPRERRDLVRRHLPGNRAVVSRYGIADPGAFTELPDPDEAWQPPRPVTRSEVAAAFREAVARAGTGRRRLGALRFRARLAPIFVRMWATAPAG